MVCPVASVSGHRMRPTVVGGTTLLGLDPVRPSAVALRVKAVVDRVCAGLILLVAAPVLAVLMLAIRVDSRGPAIFMQTRVGRDGVPFRMFKFRSMYVDAESMKQALIEENEADGALFKIRRDPRITRIGFWLRRSSLDELPQLVNVVLGQMSLVGPRPALPAEVERYDDDRPSPARGQARHHRSLAGQRPLRPRLGRVPPARHLLRRELAAAGRPGHRGPHGDRGRAGARRVLRRAREGLVQRVTSVSSSCPCPPLPPPPTTTSSPPGPPPSPASC